jgi:hypothetical protein
MSNIFVSFQFVQIMFMYCPYLFSIQSSGSPCVQINTQDTYDLWFGRSLYAWKYKDIIFLTQPISWSTKIRVSCNCKNKIVFQNHRNVIFHFHKTSSLTLACTHKYEIIPFHNILMTNLSITYIYLPCLCLISLFISNLSKSRLFTSHTCFQFGVHDHIASKLTHMTRTIFNLDVLYMHEKNKEIIFPTQPDSWSSKTGVSHNRRNKII